MSLQDKNSDEYKGMTLQEVVHMLNLFLREGEDPNTPVRKDEGNRWLTPVFDITATIDTWTGERVISL
jgi:hypothetical protein